MSHPDNCDCDYDIYTGILECFCDSIMLPPNVNAPEGEGYFSFSVLPKSGLTYDTEISNVAWIRFDYNAWLQAPESGVLLRTIGVVCGDVNMDGSVNIFDIAAIISYLYMDGPEPYPYDAANVNGDATINIFDITHLIAFLYLDGADPVSYTHLRAHET